MFLKELHPITVVGKNIREKCCANGLVVLCGYHPRLDKEFAKEFDGELMNGFLLNISCREFSSEDMLLTIMAGCVEIQGRGGAIDIWLVSVVEGFQGFQDICSLFPILSGRLSHQRRWPGRFTVGELLSCLDLISQRAGFWG